MLAGYFGPNPGLIEQAASGAVRVVAETCNFQ